ncbi:MAG TPA: methionyl-tRNA formyltransferase, partial [Candidatus Nanopelagicaceae bacterium]
MRVAVAATPSVALPTLDWLHTSEHELSLVITRPDRPAGRGRTLRGSVVAQWAQAHEVVVLKPESSEALVQKLLNVDVVITIGYGVILPIAVLSTPKFGFINLHFSLLPSWRGAAPVQRAILHGDTTSGVTVFALDAGMDTGPIYVSQQMMIEPDENAAHLLERMAALGPTVVAKALDLVSQEFAPVPQRAEGVSYAPKITKDEAKINWGVSATSIDCQVRA